ncbi:GNAT family N-acetyltransferase [Prescottella sp. R16]|uniref:GNAT family N-acetyltransferase n=1 Tax=Prescottella sp. R16 TaxID=3064529 RepID=UPI00272E9F0F|nr:GNAT family N-acetyltransferase [Prescottella sp. R16]
MDRHQIDIVRLAWARELGLPDRSFDTGGVRHVRADTDHVRFVSIAGAAALVGPEWAVDRAHALTDDDLAAPGGLRTLAGDRAGRSTGPVVLGWAADFGTAPPVRNPLVSHDLEHVRILEGACPPDDVAEAALATKSDWFTVLGDTHRPVASAARTELQGIVADMGVLTDPAVRRRGFGTTAGLLATNDALDAGLVPQWRAHRDNIASRRLAARLGFEELGTYAAISVSRSTV